MASIAPDICIVPVILCGGAGSRLWPLSREDNPKQFLSLTNNLSLLQNTMIRALRMTHAPAKNLVTVTLESMKDKVREHLIDIDRDAATHILCEPCARNTAAAIAFAADYVRCTFGEKAVMWVLPSDHHIGQEEILENAFLHALSDAKAEKLVTFGITPTYPETGYGYIRAEKNNAAVKAVLEFAEKPDLETAKQYLESGDYLWNSGMFVFTARAVLDHFETYAPSVIAAVKSAMDGSLTHPSAESYIKIPSQPFDKAIMEKASSVSVVPCDPAWSDIGGWESLWQIAVQDENGNVIDGDVTCVSTTNCYIQAQMGRPVAVAGLKDMVIIDTENGLLIKSKGDTESMQLLAKILKESAPMPQNSMAAKSGNVTRKVA